jgi:hypothetical protein
VVQVTLAEAQVQYDSVLKSLGFTETEFQSRRLQYSSGDARLKELAFLEDLITKLTAQQSGSSSSGTRSTFAKFNRG